MQFLGREIHYMGVGDVIFATTALNLAYSHLGLHWSSGQWLFFAMAVVAGLVIETCIAWMIGSLSFWMGRSRAIYSISMRFNMLTQNYPLDIFGQWFRVFMTGFLPVAFMNYYPLTVLLDKSNAVGAAWLGFLSPLVAIVLLVLGAIVWQRGLAGYTSSGN
jgi:ABC-2 type transport system permease protein